MLLLVVIIWESARRIRKAGFGKVFSKTIVPIALRHNGSYDDMIASVIEVGDLICEPNDFVISYQIVTTQNES